MTATSENDDWLTDELMQRASKLIQDIDGIASQGSIYVVSRAIYEAEKRGREEAAKIAESYGLNLMQISVMGLPASPRPSEARDVAVALNEIAAAIRSGQ